MAHKPPAVMPLLKEPSGEGSDLLGKDEPVLAPGTHPERETCDECLVMVEPLRDDHPHADDEQPPQHHGEIRREDGPRQGEDEGDDLRKECDYDDCGPEHHADPARGHTRHLGERDGCRAHCDHHGARKTCEQVPESVGRERSLHGAKVRCPTPTPRDALDGERRTDRSNGARERDEQKRGQKAPERRTELSLEGGPRRARNTDPGRARHPTEVIEAEEPTDEGSTHESDDRCPRAQRACSPEREPCQQHDGGEGACERVRRGVSGGNIVEPPEDDRHHGHRNQEDDCA